MLDFFRSISVFCADNAIPLLAWFSGAITVLLIWLHRHPEDFYTIEEITDETEEAESK